MTAILARLFIAASPDGICDVGGILSEPPRPFVLLDDNPLSLDCDAICD